MKFVLFNYNFLPVGQGLFASGKLMRRRPRPGFNKEFVWVYDCGTNSDRAFLRREIGAFKSRLHGPGKRVDLMVLSHYDEEQVNGLKELLGDTRIESLFLPYLSPEQRMRRAAAIPDINPDYLRFLMDPAGHLLEVAGGNIGRIVYITPDAEVPSPVDAAVPLGPIDELQGGPEFNLDGLPAAPEPGVPAENGGQEPKPGEAKGQGAEVSGQPKERVFYVSHAVRFAVEGIWEFMFYNKATGAGLEAVRPLVEGIMAGHRSAGRDVREGGGLIRELKALYAQHLDDGSGPRRPGGEDDYDSLVAYAGPVYESFAVLGHCHLGIHSPDTRDFDAPRTGHHLEVSLTRSILYTGDFKISRSSIRALEKHFGVWRLERVMLMQVPRHGAKQSWFPGAAGHFRHSHSVFSSARQSRQHPHQSVIDDLSAHAPTFVHEYQGAVCWGWLRLK